MTTFGFECEFEQNAAEVSAYLHAENRNAGPFIGAAELHRYHCDCEHCRISDFDNGFIYPFRAQTDSSCSGEIITKIFTDMDEARPFMTKLQEAAVEVDAVPGYNSGFHVHVAIPGNNDDPDMGRAERFLQYLRWESTLSFISRGRFDILRSMNQPVNTMLAYKYEELMLTIPNTPRLRTSNLAGLVFDHLDRMTTRTEKLQWLSQIYRQHRNHDRHSNLNLTTRNNTWEFRLFNSTRSAWRMELFCWLALAFANNDFIATLAEAPRPDIGTTTNQAAEIFAVCLLNAGMEEAEQLLRRQITYLNGIDNGSIPFIADLLTV